MQFTEEHIAFKHTVQQFVEKEINPNVDVWESEKIFPAHQLFKKMGDLDLLGITRAEADGGLGLDVSFQLVFAEALGECDCAAIPMAIGVQADMATPALANHGSKQLKNEFLTPAIKGDMVACIGVSEPHAGSDVASIKTHAKKDGDDYIINGTKMWITNSTQADWICLLANTGEGPVHKNKSLIIVPMDSPGINVQPKLDKLGMWSSDTAQIFFDNVRVPQRYLVGEEGRGFVYQMEQFQNERLFAAASALRAMESVINETVDYTKGRQAFGRSIIDNQSVHFKLAELQAEVELLRALTYQAYEQQVAGEDVTTLASMAKLKAGRLSRVIADNCLQYWGGMGYMWESKVSRYYRDTRLLSIGAGADEVMLDIISRRLAYV